MKVINRISFFVLLIAPLCSYGQNVMTSSPYSMFGIGEILTGLYNSNAAMGGLSLSMRGSMLINTDNPAGLTGIDSCRLLAEASLFAKWESYQSQGSGNHAFTGNLSRFSLAGRIMPRWYMATGVTPYSSVGYYFQSTQELEGSPGSYYKSTFSGNGGLSKLFLSNAFLIGKGLSIGINANYIFGNITQSEEQSTMSVSQKLYGKAFTADFGIQYARQIGRETHLSLGALYSLSQDIKMENKKIISESSNSGSFSERSVRQQLPNSWGIGSAILYKKMTYGLDYLFQGYGSLHSEDSRFTFCNSHEIRIGSCYSPGGYSSQNLWKRMDYKIGIGITTPYYMEMRGESGLSWRIHAGLGFPLSNGKLNVALFYDQVEIGKNRLERSLTGVTVTYTLSERLFKVKL